jgi:drug/metabolite transporter (DMT)-like permease
MGVYHIDRQRRLCKRKAEADQPSIPDPVLDTPKFNAFIFIIPALFQMFAKCLSFYSLMLTYASSYQTLRGASIVFTALLTKLFLKRKIAWIRWFGILIITVGLILIGVTDMLMATSPDNRYNFHAIFFEL